MNERDQLKEWQKIEGWKQRKKKERQDNVETSDSAKEKRNKFHLSLISNSLWHRFCFLRTSTYSAFHFVLLIHCFCFLPSFSLCFLFFFLSSSLSFFLSFFLSLSLPLWLSIFHPHRRQPLILANLILTLNIYIVLARPCVGVTAHIWCQMNEDKLKIVS